MDILIFVSNTEIDKHDGAITTVATNNILGLVEYRFQLLRGFCYWDFPELLKLICVTHNLSYSWL